ncbi:MAG: hypothetical protein N2234_10410, partial [Planctomycetota bacterium]|nr:hypothetical protein [Planctomycetota bacterium]
MLLKRFLIFGAVVVAAVPLFGQSLGIEEVSLLSEGGYRCGYWQMLVVAYNAPEGVEGAILLKVGLLRFRAHIRAPAHSSGVVKIPFFIPYPDAPLELYFRTDSEEYLYSDASLQLKNLLVEAKGLFCGYFSEVSVRFDGSKALIRETFLDDEVYLRQFDVVFVGEERLRRLSSDARAALERFVLGGGCAVVVNRGESTTPKIERKERKGRGLLLTIGVPMREAPVELPEEIVSEIISSVTKKNPSIKGVLAVSPRRYADRASLWLILCGTFACALLYIALAFRYHPVFLRKSLPGVVSSLFAVLFTLFPPASFWRVEGEIWTVS